MDAKPHPGPKEKPHPLHPLSMTRAIERPCYGWRGGENGGRSALCPYRRTCSCVRPHKGHGQGMPCPYIPSRSGAQTPRNKRRGEPYGTFTDMVCPWGAEGTMHRAPTLPGRRVHGHGSDEVDGGRGVAHLYDGQGMPCPNKSVCVKHGRFVNRPYALGHRGRQRTGGREMPTLGIISPSRSASHQPC